MPIYLYEPTIYSDQDSVNECCFFDILQSLHENPLQTCPTCGHAIHRAVTCFSITKPNITSNPNNDPYSAFSKNNDSSAAKAAKFAMRHICKSGCSH